MLILPSLSPKGQAVGQVADPLDFYDEPIITSMAGRYMSASVVSSHTAVSPGETFHVALVIELTDGWVYYSPDPGPPVMAGELSVSAGDLQAGQVLWPKDKPKTISLGDEAITNNAYTHRVVVYVPLTVPAGAAPGTRSLTLTPQGQICSDVCIDIQDLSFTTEVTVADSSQPNPAWTDELAGGIAHAMTAEQLKASHAAPGGVIAAGGAASLTLWAGLGLALLAGLTLNIMPCVLPVIPIRILSIVAMAGDSRRRFVTLGLAFAGGIMLFFVGLAVANIVLRLAFDQAVNVSDHFTLPSVRIALAMLLVALAVNLFGAFNVTVPSRIAGMEGGEGHAKTLGMGLMMAILATPCSFAYLLAAMAWAQVQPLWLGTIGILTIGLGMAGPHALLCAFPGLVSKLPKPGRWMELFKQSMGFLLLPVAIWLISTLSEETWPFWVTAYGVVLAFALWMGSMWVRYDATFGKKLIVRGLALAIALGGGVWMLTPPPEPVTHFADFDESLIERGRAGGRVVLVKATASWCTECIVLDYRVFNTPEISRQFSDFNVLAVKADVTNRSKPAALWLRREFNGSPPLTIVYPSDGGPPITLTGGFSKARLTEVLREAAGGE